MKYFLLYFFYFMFLSASAQDNGGCDSKFKNYNWMEQITKNPVNNWTKQPLNNLLFPGSHDAGLDAVTEKSFLALGVPDYYFVAQGLNVTEQLCAGCRWFDLRFSWISSSWKLFHGQSSINAYGADLATVMAETSAFLNAFPHEVVFWRIKIDSAYKNLIQNFADTLRSTMSKFMLDPVGDFPLSDMSLDSVYSQQKPGNLFVMAYDWEASSVPLGQGHIWDYASNQDGAYADANTMNGMITKCSVGQQVALMDYRRLYPSNENNSRPLLGLWWTFTGGDIRTNTASMWQQYPNGLNDYYVRNSGEIGNVLIVDFFGSNGAVMDIVIAYNVNKYGTAIPLSPTAGFQLSDVPPLPGSMILSGGPCDNSNSDNATDQQVTLFIGIAIGVLLAILVVLILIIVGIVYLCRRRKNRNISIQETRYHNLV